MRPRRFHAANKVFRLEGGTEDNDLWVQAGIMEGAGHVLRSVWVPTRDERLKIANGHNIELIIHGTGQPPVAVGVTDTPIGKTPQPPD